MKQYTYEERKLIRDFLQDIKTDIYFLNIPVEHRKEVSIYVDTVIEHLNKIVYSDIKNIDGTKFKPKGYDSEFIIASDNIYGEDKYVVNITKGIILNTSTFHDDIEVEIL